MKAAPFAPIVPTIMMELLSVVPRNTNTFGAGKTGVGDFLGNAQSLENRLDSRMQRFSGLRAGRPPALKERRAQSSLGAANRASKAGRAATNYDDMEVALQIWHGPVRHLRRFRRGY
jgi:hypothetical protein